MSAYNLICINIIVTIAINNTPWKIINVLENNGTILCDDYDLSYAPGVKQAIDEFVQNKNLKCTILKRFAKIEKL